MTSNDQLDAAPASIVIQGSPDPDELSPDGTPWKYALIRGDDTVLANEPGAIIGHLIDGYDEIADDEEGDDEALLRRVEESVVICSMVQAMLCVEATGEGTFDPAEESEDVLTALLGDRTVPVLYVDEWTHEVPLVVLTTDYDPYTTHLAPRGNVWFIDPADEAVFLHSLARIGIIQLYVHGDA